MKIVEKKEFNDFVKHDAMFFTNDGVIIDCRINSPVMKFKQSLDALDIEISRVYLDKNLLFVRSNLPTTSTHSVLGKDFRICPVKSFLRETSENTINQMLRGFHWLTWDEKYQHCSKCGNKLSKVIDIMEKKCIPCDLSFFPNLSPAVMVLIKRKNEILLARSPHFRSGLYSALAGFVDIGETAELAAHREVKEEVGLEITQLEYFGSQSWPFPNSFMIAFKANYLKGELVIDPNEIEDAKWFNINNMPELPPLPSIARKLINSVIS